jgi:hypothetical protein
MAPDTFADLAAGQTPARAEDWALAAQTVELNVAVVEAAATAIQQLLQQLLQNLLQHLLQPP